MRLRSGPRMRGVLMALAALGLAACGNAQFEDGFNKGFQKSAKESCLKSAKGAGATDALADSYCTCFVDKVSAWTTQEKMAINPNSEKFKQVVAQCQPK